MVTITDVAQAAGVSKNTVSRYLNQRGYISDKTRAAIQAAIDELHYQPNQIARSLYTHKTNLIGLVIPDVEHPFFSAITAQIEDELDARGYKMILCNTLHSSKKERKYLDLLIANKVDGIIIGSHSIDINYSADRRIGPQSVRRHTRRRRRPCQRRRNRRGRLHRTRLPQGDPAGVFRIRQNTFKQTA